MKEKTKRRKWEKRIPFFCLLGYPGVGKTHVLKELLEGYPVHFIPRYTCRPRRLGEENSPEYKFVSIEKFVALAARGFFISGTIRRTEVNREPYFMAIPKKGIGRTHLKEPSLSWPFLE